jgi:hypothetical protein
VSESAGGMLVWTSPGKVCRWLDEQVSIGRSHSGGSARRGVPEQRAEGCVAVESLSGSFAAVSKKKKKRGEHVHERPVNVDVDVDGYSLLSGDVGDRQSDAPDAPTTPAPGKILRRRRRYLI